MATSRYVTQASRDLIDNLHIQDATYLERARKATDRYEAGLWQGYHDATQIYIEFAEGWLEKIEAEARLIPEVDDDVMSIAEKIASEYWPSAA